MPKPAFYKPPPRWHFFAALVAAFALELAAVAVAGLHHSKEVPVVTGASDDFEAVAFITDVPPEPTPPPDAPPPVVPPPPEDPTDFVVIEAPHPPKAQATKVRTQLAVTKTTPGRSGAVSFRSVERGMLFAPHPRYPYEARRAQQTGHGRFLLTFDESGSVVEVKIMQSTGSALLDQVSTSVFRRWKCRPGSYHEVMVPVTFTLEGAQL